MIYLKKLLLKVVKLTEFRKAGQKFQRCIPKKTIKAKIASHVRDRRGALRNISMIPDYLFRRIFRLDKETFAAVLLLIFPLLAKDNEKATLNGSGGEISPEVMLLATLRFLAGGMKWDICLSLDISPGSFWGERGVIWPTLYAIDALEEFEIGLPLNDNQEMKKIAEEFAGMCSNSSEQFWGCVMAIDGWVCSTRKPHEGETKFPRLDEFQMHEFFMNSNFFHENCRKYRNRKGLWGITVFQKLIFFMHILGNIEITVFHKFIFFMHSNFFHAYFRKYRKHNFS